MLYARFEHPDAGWDHDRERVSSLNLEVGKRYLVEDVNMGQSYTGILLDGFCGYLNSVHFEFEEDNYTPVDIYKDPRYNNYLRR